MGWMDGWMDGLMVIIGHRSSVPTSNKITYLAVTGVLNNNVVVTCLSYLSRCQGILICQRKVGIIIDQPKAISRGSLSAECQKSVADCQKHCLIVEIRN